MVPIFNSLSIFVIFVTGRRVLIRADHLGLSKAQTSHAPPYLGSTPDHSVPLHLANPTPINYQHPRTSLVQAQE